MLILGLNCIATVGFSLESANVVGYTEFATAAKKQPSFGACFMPLNGATSYKLKDLVPSNFDPDADGIQVINPITLGADYIYVYMSKEIADAAAEEDGEAPGAYDDLIGWWDSIFDASTGDLLGSASGTSIKFSSTGSKFNTGIEVVSDAILANTEYTYSIVISGTMDALTGRGVDGDFDYSAATLTTAISGSITTAGMGATTLTTATPSAWTVSGITAVPEPTSGLLMLVGLAGLALRRRRA